jgi:pilus assembly protein CpaB
MQRLIPVLILALALSGGASFIVYRLIAGKLESGKAQARATVIVAVRDLPVGTLLKASDVKLAGWPGAVPPGGIKDLAAAVGRGVAAPLFRGEVVLEQRLAAKGAGAGLAPTIPFGKRAVAIRVNEVAGISGFAVPGMRVDVVVQARPNGGAGRAEAFAKTILQNVEILSAGQKYQRDAEGKPMAVQSVTLLVEPEHAELLTLANNEARLQLVLRNPLDVSQAQTKGSGLPDIFPFVGRSPVPAPRTVAVRPRQRTVAPPGMAAPLAPNPAPPAPFHVELWHGLKKSEEKFAAEGES